MNSSSLEKLYERSKQKVDILEKMIEDKTREIYLEHQKVEKSSKFLSRILASMSGGVIVANSDCEITIVNNSALEILNEKRSNIIGKEFKKFFSIENFEFDSYKELPLKQTEGLLKVKEKTQKVPISFAFSILNNENEEMEAIVCLFQDLSQMKLLERQLLQAQKLESIGQLAAGIAHEINTPIQYIRDNTAFVKDEFNNVKNLLLEMKNLLSVLEKNNLLNENREKISAIIENIDLNYIIDEIPEALKQSFEGAESVSRIVRSMKTFSHPGSDKKSHANINEAIETTIAVSKSEWKFVSEVILDLDHSLPLINCYPGELNQVLLNLVVNAAHAISDATDEGKNGKGLIYISSKKNDSNLEISIKDSGTGIPKEIIDKIFDPFFTTKEQGKGTGQGLALVYSTIVERHNGTINCETKIGEGTTFYISIPIKQQ